MEATGAGAAAHRRRACPKLRCRPGSTRRIFYKSVKRALQPHLRRARPDHRRDRRLRRHQRDGDGDHRAHPRDRHPARARHPAGAAACARSRSRAWCSAASARCCGAVLALGVSVLLLVVPGADAAAARPHARLSAADRRGDPTLYLATLVAMVRARDARIRLGRAAHRAHAGRRCAGPHLSDSLETCDENSLDPRCRRAGRARRLRHTSAVAQDVADLAEGGRQVPHRAATTCRSRPRSACSTRDGSPDKERRYTVFAQAEHQSLVLMRSPAEQGQKVLMLGDDFWLLMPGSQRPAAHHADAEAARRRVHRRHRDDELGRGLHRHAGRRGALRRARAAMPAPEPGRERARA